MEQLKRSKTYNLSDACIEKVNELSKRHKMTKSVVIEALVMGEIIPTNVEQKYLEIAKELGEMKSMMIKIFMEK